MKLMEIKDLIKNSTDDFMNELYLTYFFFYF